MKIKLCLYSHIYYVIWLITTTFWDQVSAAEVIPSHTRIAHGKDAHPGEFPYQVSIQPTYVPNYHHCGGVIIDPKYVLTAAHCVAGFSEEDFKIVAGTVNLESPSFTTYISNIYIPENFDTSVLFKNDIALLKVSRPFPLTKSIGLAVLPRNNSNVKLNDRGLVPGFGSDSVNGRASNSLKKVELFIQNLDFCRDEYPKASADLDNTHICAYNPDAGGVWKGDSGGPFVINNVVHGIAISGLRDWTDHNYPSIFINVSKFLPWLRKFVDCINCLNSRL